MVQERNGKSDEGGGASVGALSKVVEEIVKNPRKPKRVTVRVVGKHGKALIVESCAKGLDPVRLVVPSHVIEYRGEDATLSEDDLDACIPYGADWEKHLKITVTAEDVVKMLRKRGIWTVEDFEKRFLQARQGTLGLIMQDVMRMFTAARKEANR